MKKVLKGAKDGTKMGPPWGPLWEKSGKKPTKRDECFFGNWGIDLSLNKYIHIYYICIRMFIHKTRLGIYWVYRYIPR